MFVLIDLEGKVNTVCIGKQSMALGKKKTKNQTNKPSVSLTKQMCVRGWPVVRLDSLSGPRRIIIKHNKFFTYVRLSVCIYLFLHGLGRMSVGGKDELEYWKELEVESEVVHAHKSSERHLSNSSVRKSQFEDGILAQGLQWTVTKGQVCA